MADRIDNQDTAGDFGFDKKKPTRAKKDRAYGNDAEAPNVVGEGYGVASKPFTLDNLLSGNTYTASTQVVPTVSASTEVSLDYEMASNLAFFGSVYTRVAVAVDRVRAEYPNGVIIQQAITGAP